MNKEKASSNPIHKVPEDLRKALTYDLKVREAWNKITSLARNEWICWIISCKKKETREKHVNRTIKELKEGIRRPCCWRGCVHRKKNK